MNNTAWFNAAVDQHNAYITELQQHQETQQKTIRSINTEENLTKYTLLLSFTGVFFICVNQQFYGIIMLSLASSIYIITNIIYHRRQNNILTYNTTLQNYHTYIKNVFGEEAHPHCEYNEEADLFELQVYNADVFFTVGWSEEEIEVKKFTNRH